MKSKNVSVTMRFLIAFMCAVLLLWFLPNFRSATGAGAEDAPADSLVLKEVDAWDTDGYKIEKVSGTIAGSDVGGTEDSYAYDYKITISDEIWFIDVKGKRKAINNVSSRVFDFELTYLTADGKSIRVDGGDDICTTSSSFLNINSSTNDEIAEIGWSKNANGFREAWVNAGQVLGSTILTCGFDNKTINTDGDSAYDGTTLNASVSILYECVKKDNTPFTFTGAVKDLNNNANAVWLYGVSIPEANEEWSKAEEVGALFKEFYGNIYYLEGNEDGSAKELTDENLAGNDFYTIESNKGVDALKFQIEVRDDHMEIKKLARQYENDADGTAVDFEEGDAIYLKAGLYYLGKDGNTEWCLYERGFSFFELSRDQYFVYGGESVGWSVDELGYVISFESTKESVDVGESVTLTPGLVGGSALPAEKKTVTWVSSDENVATVDENGVVTGVAEGTVTITATTGTGDYATVTVSVVPSDSITSIRLNATNVSLNVNGTREVKATVTGGSAADLSVSWSSSDESVATVDENGLITAVAPGSCTITATASDGQTASLNVTVREGATDTSDPSGDSSSTGDSSSAGDSSVADSGTTSGSSASEGCGSTLVPAAALSFLLLAGVAVTVILRKRKE